MTNMEDQWLSGPALPLYEEARAQAAKRQGELTKPPGALGRLEELAISLCAMQGYEYPEMERILVTVFAADHGIAREGVSAFPQAVTAEMIRNFARGGAAICVAAREIGARLEVVNLGTVSPLEGLEGVRDLPLGPGTASFVQGPAMTPEQLFAAMEAGRQSALVAKSMQADLFIGGEMGIGNTSAAAALACALLDRDAQSLAGPGTGLEAGGVKRKARIIARALDLHRPAFEQGPLEILRRLGGFEIAGLCGAYIACAQEGIAILVDGYISTAAALLAVRINPGVRNWMLFSHNSAEPGHRLMLEALKARPLLDLGMRLGEGSGAAVAVPLLRMACALHNEMATFAEAGVSGKDE